MTPGSWGAQDCDPGPAGEVRQSKVGWGGGSEQQSGTFPRSSQKAGRGEGQDGGGGEEKEEEVEERKGGEKPAYRHFQELPVIT